jgi:hypothetical protein
MDKMKKVAIAMPVHCAPKIAQMTLGTWLEACDGSYEAKVFVSVHQNYFHYHPGLPELQAMPVTILGVPEMNWSITNMGQSIQRYSTMHCHCLSALFTMIGREEFDYVVVLDHDLVFKADFVKAAMGTGTDLIGGYFGDRKESVIQDTAMGRLMFVPKFTIWHLAMSNVFFRRLMGDCGLIYPIIEDGFFYDSFSRVILKNDAEWNFPVTEWSTAEMEKMVEHRWSMSFNFGQVIHGVHSYHKRLVKYEAEYDARFPRGIRHLFEKVGL